MSGAFDAGTASGRLILDIKEWSANVEKAKADTKSLGGVVAAHKEDIEKLGKAFTVAGAAIVGALGMAVKSAMNFTLEAGRMADKTGIAVETISGLREAADDAEVTMQDLSGGFRKYSTTIADAAGGNKTAQDSLKKLGIEIFDSSGKLKTMDELLLEAADRFSKMEGGAEKAALAQDLFGRNGAALIPLFNKGAEGIRAYTEDVRKSGQMITQEGVEKARAFRIGMDNLDDAFMAVKLSIAQALMPVVKTLAETFAFLVGTVRSVLDIFPPLGNTITIVVGAVGGLLAVLGPLLLLWTKLAPVITQISALIPILNARLVSLKMSLGFVAVAFTAAVLAIEAATWAIKKYSDSCDKAIADIYKTAQENKRNWDFIKETIRGANTKIAESIQAARKRLTEMGYTSEEIGAIIYKQFNKISTAVKTVAKDVEEMAAKVADVEKELATKIAEATMSEYAFRIFQAKQYYADLKEKIKGSVDEAKINALADEGLAKELTKIKKEESEKVTEAKKSSLEKQFKNAEEAFKKEEKLWFDGFKAFNASENEKMEVAQTITQRINTYWAEMGKKINAELKKDTDKIQSAFKKTMDKVDGYVQVMQQGFGQYFSAMSNKSDIYYQHEFAKLDKLYQKQKDALAKEYNAKIAALDAKDAAETLQARRHDILISNMTAAEKKAALAEIDTEQKKIADRKKIEDDYAIAQAALEADQAAQKKELERKQTEQTKNQNIAQAYMNMFAGMVAAYKLGWPLGAIAAALTAIACKIQISNIKAQAVPMAEGGLVKQPTHVLAGEAGPEAIMPMRELKRMLGISTKNRGAGSKTVNVNINAIDTSGMEQFTRRVMIPEIKRALVHEELTVPPNAVR